MAIGDPTYQGSSYSSGKLPVIGADGITLEDGPGYDSTTRVIEAATGRTVTYVIAASDATATEKAQADVVCDGTDDDVEIQAAITALGADGGKVSLSQGTFSVTSPILVGSNTWIQGSGRGGTTLSLDADVDSIFYSSTTEQTTFSGISDMWLKGNKSVRSTGSGIILGQTRRLVFENLYVSDFKTDGIQYGTLDSDHQGASDIITRCYFIDMGNNGITISQYANNKQLSKLAFDSCANHTIEVRGAGVNIVQCEVGYSTGSGSIWISSASNKCRIEANAIGSAGGFAIYVAGGAGEHVITGNYIINLTAASGTVDGIYLSLTENCVITDNIIRGASGKEHRAGVFLHSTDNCIINSNKIFGSLTGIMSDGTSSGNMIHGNDVLNNTTSVNLAGVDNVYGNEGYIAPGEIRTATVSLAAALNGAIGASWHNPEAQDCYIKRVVVSVNSAAAAAATGKVGIADDDAGTNLGAEFFTAITLDSTGVYDSYVAGDTGAQTKYVAIQDSASATDGWINLMVETNDSTATGTMYIEYVGM